jgi:hypothetical protein
MFLKGLPERMKHLDVCRATRVHAGEYVCIGDSGYGPQAEDTLEVKITCKYVCISDSGYGP